jgi:SNF2 family DNA or RNA helicase
VLDEAQRIKNWQIKTARRVKSLRSPFAFVLRACQKMNHSLLLG